jgi:predicted ATPase/class 3 adenylate cyclase/DNA-binding CsgD family transcriptional regulator
MHHLPMGTVTLLFTDIEGSTRLLQHLSERYPSVLSECRHLLRAAFHEHHGYEVDMQGDAFFMAFARASDAVSAAIAAQRALVSHAFPQGAAVQVRMGLHTGEPQLSAEGYTSLDVHRAACIMSAGHGGQVLLSQTTRDLVEHDLPTEVGLRDLGAHRLKDLEQKSHLFQLVIAGLPAAFPPLKTLDTHPNNLPVQPTPFIGRAKEVVLVQDLLLREEVRLLTLTGPGGTGKTRMALQVAAELSDRFADGVFFVNLAPISDPAFVVPTIAQALDVKEFAEQPVHDLLKAFLREKELLLLLDNFEQVVSAALQVADLLVTCPQLKVLVTSRIVLHVQAEHEFAVPPLTVPDPRHLPDVVALAQYEAVAFFLERAQAIKPTFQLTSTNAQTVAEICVRLDGLPLAIELAAARIKLLPPQALLTRLGQRLQVLTSGARDAPERQQTLRNTIAWSYELLNAKEQRLFRRLSVFAGGCTLQAIETVCAALDESNGAGRMLDEVASLIDKSLLQQTEQEGEEPRLMMLETVREYAWECLCAAGEQEQALEGHIAYFLRLAEESVRHFYLADQAYWHQRLEREHDNLRAALNWSLKQAESERDKRAIERRETALRLASALLTFWAVRGYINEGRSWLHRALLNSEGITALVRAKALEGAAFLSLLQDDVNQVMSQSEMCLQLYREIGETRGTARALIHLSHCALRKGSIEQARTLYRESLGFVKCLSDAVHLPGLLCYLGALATDLGRYEEACLLLQESLDLARKMGNKQVMTWTLRYLGRVFFLQSDETQASTLFEESLTLCREMAHSPGEAHALYWLGRVALSLGDRGKARRLLEESLFLFRTLGIQQQSIALILCLLARIATLQGDEAMAHSLCQESLALFQQLDDKAGIACCLQEWGRLLARQGQTVCAIRLWGAAEKLSLKSPPCGLFLLPIESTDGERADYEHMMAALRTQLGEKAFTAPWAEGRAMSPEQALASLGSGVRSKGTASKSPPTLSPTYPDGLTAREVEVLRLVAQGLTNDQVAEQLVISPRTVNTHLTSIYGKIGISSRSAATRYAIEHHLV